MIFQFYSSQRGGVQRSRQNTHNPQNPVEILVFTQHKVLSSENIQSALSLSRTHKNSGCQCAKTYGNWWLWTEESTLELNECFTNIQKMLTALYARWKHVKIYLFSSAFHLVLMARIHYPSVEIHQSGHYHLMDITWNCASPIGVIDIFINKLPMQMDAFGWTI